MTKPGIVNVEINIERDIINKLIKIDGYIIDEIRSHSSGTSGPRQVYLMIEHAILPEIIRLKKLKAREPGKSKYRELPFINEAINNIKNFRFHDDEFSDTDTPALHNLIVYLIRDFQKLKKMELRLG